MKSQRPMSSRKLFIVVFLPLFCFLSWSCSASSTTVPLLSPPSSALLAAETLRTRGYSLFASVMVSLATITTNFSGTIFAPPDFAFSFANAKFLNNRRPPPAPSVSLLLYHTLRPPLILTWPALSSRGDGDELRTFYNSNCLYLFRNPHGGGVSISSSPFKNSLRAVEIRQPDLYVDERLTVHGIDGVLDPAFATKCASARVDSVAEGVPHRQVNRTFLDHAMRALRKTAYNVVAAAMAVRRSELLSLTSVTIFAVSDKNLFLKPGGFRYDFRHHVVPMRHRIAALARTDAGETELVTLAPNKTVLVDSVDGAVSVDSVAVGSKEVYHNRWIVVLSIMTSLDDVEDPPITLRSDPEISAPSPTPFLGVPPDSNPYRVPSPAPVNFLSDSIGSISGETPSPASTLGLGLADNTPNSADTTSSWSAAPDTVAAQNSGSTPTPSQATEDISDTHCDLNAVVSIGVEGGDIFCPVGTARRLRETEALSGVRVDAYGQVGHDLTQPENVNIADDLFFYI